MRVLTKIINVLALILATLCIFYRLEYASLQLQVSSRTITTFFLCTEIVFLVTLLINILYFTKDRLLLLVTILLLIVGAVFMLLYYILDVSYWWSIPLLTIWSLAMIYECFYIVIKK